MIFVGLVAIFRRNEFLAWNTRHCREHPLVPNSSRAQLCLHHIPALRKETIDWSFRRHGFVVIRITRIFTTRIFGPAGESYKITFLVPCTENP